MTDLGTLGGYDSHATSINDLGQVAGYSEISLVGNQYHAFQWVKGRGMIDLGVPSMHSNAQGMNNLGQVIGIYYGYYTGSWAFLWNNGVLSDLSTLGSGNSGATDINDLGQMVGSSQTASGEYHAFLWENGYVTDLGTLGGDNSTAMGINEQGQVVGFSATLSGESHAFLWTVSPEGQIHDIIEHVGELVEGGLLNPGQGNALQSKLENALVQLEKGKLQVACNLLNAFTSQVESLIDEEILPLEEGQSLIDEANVVRSQICR